MNCLRGALAIEPATEGEASMRQKGIDPRRKKVVQGALEDTVRQRRNLGSTNIGGFQTDVSYRVNGRWGVSGAYLFNVAKVHESETDPSGENLTGKYLAEVPKHRASFQVTWRR